MESICAMAAHVREFKVIRVQQTRYPKWIATISRLMLLLVAGFCVCNAVFAYDEPQKEFRLNMGFYLRSITEVANRSDIEISLNYWANEVIVTEGNKYNFHITSSKVMLFERIDEMRDAFERGEIDMLIAPPLLLAKHFKREDLGDGFIGLLEGKKPEGLLLISRIDKQINRIQDLRNKRLMIIDEDDLAEVFLDTLVLTALQKNYNDIGLAIKRQKKSNSIVLDVFFDKTDTGVVYSSSYDIMAELNPDIKHKIKVLAEYPIKSKNFSYFRRDYPLIQQLTNLAMNFPGNGRARQMLEIFKTPEVDYCRVNELDSVDAYYKDYLKLKKHEKK